MWRPGDTIPLGPAGRSASSALVWTGIDETPVLIVEDVSE
jgi:hypothetical protein